VNLREVIMREIRDLGPIPFSRYMWLCLYHPELGYYARNAEQFGKAGDFYTSSDVHAVFGRLLARQFDEMWRVLGCPVRIQITELGPGRGLFAQDVLDWSQKTFPDFFAATHYLLVEQSPALRAKIQDTLGRHVDAGKASVVATLSPANDVPVILFANEFVDALPVEILSDHGMLRIELRDGKLVEGWEPVPTQLREFLERYSVLPVTGERLEAPLLAQSCMAEAARTIRQGFLVAIDYGYTQREQIEGRHRGTLMTYRRHSAGVNPYEAPGEQDITAHVNFTALADAANAQGMEVQPLLTQSQFLMGIGEGNQFADAFAECRLPQERAKVALQLKHLVTPAGVGESFHVLLASRGVASEKVRHLAGLRFGKSHE